MNKQSLDLDRPEGDSDSDVINCVCGDDLYDGTLMIQCDRCFCWQHGICVGIKSQEACPDFYLCTECQDQDIVAGTVEMAQPHRSGTRSRRPSGGSNGNDHLSSATDSATTTATRSASTPSNSMVNSGTSNGTARSRRSREPELQPKRANSHGNNGRSRRQRSVEDGQNNGRDVEASTITTNGKSEELSSTNHQSSVSNRRKRKTDTSEDGEEGEELSTDDIGHTRSRKRTNSSDHSTEDIKPKASPVPNSMDTKEDFDMAMDVSEQHTDSMQHTSDTNQSQNQTATTTSTSNITSPKRARRTQRTGSTKPEPHVPTISYSIPSYRPRIWTGRTSLEDLRRRAQQIEGYIRRLQQDMDHCAQQDAAFFSRSLPNSSTTSPSDSLLQQTTSMVASPESIQDDVMGSRATTPDNGLSMAMVDMQLLEGIDSLLAQPSTDVVDSKLEGFPYASLLEGVRRTAVAFLDRHND
ncbi:hypothetical protein BDF19DRAFT_432938 [Syncephalis fuscata]|nr:hypothetical protein BDF19DRAFT_432938 [Syncephalis fuscata]